MPALFFPQTAEAETARPGSSIAEGNPAVMQEPSDCVVGAGLHDQIADELTFAGEWTSQIGRLGSLA
jgi:hypothetical protein